jgi:hypothetical protein
MQGADFSQSAGLGGYINLYVMAVDGHTEFNVRQQQANRPAIFAD